MMNAFSSLFKNKKTIFSILFSFLFVVCSYGFGYLNTSTKIESTLLNIHDISLLDKEFDFIHTEFYSLDDEIKLSGKDATIYIDKANGTDTSKTIFNPYCFLSNKGKKRLFDISCDNRSVSSECSISGVHLYTDNEIMQNIGLPLFRTEGNIYKLTNPRSGANSGCYIPYSLALQIIEITPDVNCCDELIDAGKVLVFDSDSGLSRTKFSINNIFFDSKDDIDWDNDKKTKYSSNFGEYNSFFSIFNRTTIFVAIYDTFQKDEVTFCCDLKDGYGSLSVFINNVVSSSYSKNGNKLDFFINQQKRIDNDLDNYATGDFFSNSYLAITFLVFLIISAIACLLLSFISLKELNFKQSVFLICILFLICTFAWVLTYPISLFGASAKLFTYLFLNKIGNEIIIFGSLVIAGLLFFRIGVTNES